MLAIFEEQLFLNSSQEFLSELWVLYQNIIPFPWNREGESSCHPQIPRLIRLHLLKSHPLFFPVTNCNQLEYHTLLSPWERWETTCLFAKYSTYRYFPQDSGISFQEIPLNSRNPLWLSLRRRKSNNIYLLIEQIKVR